MEVCIGEVEFHQRTRWKPAKLLAKRCDGAPLWKLQVTPPVYRFYSARLKSYQQEPGSHMSRALVSVNQLRNKSVREIPQGIAGADMGSILSRRSGSSKSVYAQHFAGKVFIHYHRPNESIPRIGTVWPQYHQDSASVRVEAWTHQTAKAYYDLRRPCHVVFSSARNAAAYASASASWM